MLIEDKRWKNVVDCNNLSGDENDDKEESEFEVFENWHFQMFQLFVQWLSGNPDCGNDFKARILNFFVLDKFDSEELTSDIRKSSLRRRSP